MPKIILKKKAEILGEYVVPVGTALFTVGSEAGNNVVVPDKAVSMTHLHLERQGAKYFVRDLKSAFGTFVNGIRINAPTEIRDSDTIQVGEHTLLFRQQLEAHAASASKPGAAAEESKDFWDEMKDAVLDVVQGDSASAANSPNGSAVEDFVFAMEEEPNKLDQKPHAHVAAPAGTRTTEAEPAAEPIEVSEAQEGGARYQRQVEKSPYYLLAIYGPYLGKRFQLNFGETRIGREARINDVVIRETRKGTVDSSISRRHATIAYRNNAFYLSDKRSKSRTYLNQDQLNETDDFRLTPGDEIEIVSDQQSTIFRFVAEGNWDFAFPRTAGAWWLRYRNQGLTVGSIVATFFALLLMGLGWYHLMLITDVPKPLQAAYHTFTKIEPTLGEQAANIKIDSLALRPSLPILARLNRDAYVDLAIVRSDGSMIAVHGKNRRRLWQITSIVLDARHAPTIADMNGNGLADIVALTADAHLVAIDGLHGAEIWTSPFLLKEVAGSPLVGDFDGDGRMDVAVINVEGLLHVGYARLQEPEWVNLNIEMASRAQLSCFDLDDDGTEEILIGTEHGLVLIYDGVERRVKANVDVNLSLNKLKGRFNENHQIRYPAGVVDLNGDGNADIVVVTQQGSLVCLDLANQKLEGKIKTRELWWSEVNRGVDSTGAFAYSFVLGDVDGDELADVVAVSNDGTLAAFRGLGRDGQKQPEFWRVAAGNLVQHPTLFDCDHDGRVDAVVADHEGRVKVLSGKTGATLWEDRQAIINPGEAPLLADLGDDAVLDILLFGADGLAHVFATNRNVPFSSVIWGQRFGSAKNLATLTAPPTRFGYYVALLVVAHVLLLAAYLLPFLLRRQRKRFALSLG